MRIAIMGAGALGSLIGALLSTKNDVLLITRGRHLKAIKERGLQINGLTSGTFFLSAEDYYPGDFDLIILTVKAYQTEEAIEILKKEYDDEPLITFQNGVGIADLLHDFDLIPGSTSIGATFISPGIIKHAGMGMTYIGDMTGLSERVLKIAENFSNSGLKTTAVNNIMDIRWIKAAVNACINPLTAIMKVKNGVLLERNLNSIIECVAKECETVLKDKGIRADIYEESKKVISATANNHSSMLQDIVMKRKTEIDYIAKPFTTGPCISMLYRMVKFEENRL